MHLYMAISQYGKQFMLVEVYVPVEKDTGMDRGGLQYKA